MGKHDQASFRLKLEGLRLAPATPFDQERLATYRNGSELFAILTQPKNDKLLRKYWAILGRVIKDCPTPWKDEEAASEAIKLALGIVHYGKTITGKFMQWPRSLADLEAPEFEQFYEDAIALLSSITGVDVETLKAESADVGENKHEPSEASPRADVESGTDNPAPSDGPALDHSEDDDQGAVENSEHGPALRGLMEECIENMVRDAMSMPADARKAKVAKAADAWRRELHDAPEFVERVIKTVERLIGDATEANKAKALDYLRRSLP